MNSKQSCVTPFLKQCYVTAGASLNMLSHGLVVGFSAILLPQLRAPDSSIQVDETSESWIASVFGITYIFGNLFSLLIIDQFGRKITNLSSVIITAGGWYVTVWASNVPLLIASRIIQGVSLGISGHVCPIIIAEYTSPRNRGAFLATISLAISCGVLIAHTLGSFLHWRTTALISAIILSIDFFIVSFSPETPSWLISKGRYDECKVVFRWLRGFDEEEELKRMIEGYVTAQTEEKKGREPLMRGFLKKLNYYKVTILKKEFYIPSLIVIHLYILGQWGGSTILSQYTTDVLFHVVGDRVDVPIMIVALAGHRVVSGVYMTILLDKFKRRTMVILVGSVIMISLIAIAGYAYLRPRNLLPFDHPAIGIVLLHMQMVSVSSGSLALGFILAGELFPLEYKALAGGLSYSMLSTNLFIVAKTGPFLLGEIGIHVAYSIYAGVSAYCLVIILIFLPETKNRTLQDIEDGFRKSRSSEEPAITEPLTGA